MWLGCVWICRWGRGGDGRGENLSQKENEREKRGENEKRMKEKREKRVNGELRMVEFNF